MTASSRVIEEITDNLDRRRFDITRIRRVVFSYAGKPLEATTIQMGIPMIYAHWEGYVKEVCQVYLEYIEASVSRIRELHPAVLAYLWTPRLTQLSRGLSFKRKKAIAEIALNFMSDPVLFTEKQKTIDTKSNLNFETLESIAKHLCLNITELQNWKTHLNSLVHLRNNIAHGARPSSLTSSDFDTYATNALSLMESFEQALINAIETRSFCKGSLKVVP